MEQPCGANTEAIENLKKNNVCQWSEISKQRSRLDELMRKWIPVWVALVLTTMGTITGSALTIAVMAVKMR